MKLNQIVAVVNGQKTRLEKAISKLYKKIQAPTLFDGLTRRYNPSDDEGERLPSENKRVQLTVDEVITELKNLWVDPLDCIATQDLGNSHAIVDVVAKNNLLIEGVPVTFLLVLEKRLVDLRTFIEKLPTLDTVEDWKKSPVEGVYESEPVVTNRSKKTPKVITLAPATKEHPAQTQVFSEDVKVGEWETTKLSGAIPESERNVYMERIDSLIDGVKQAREVANDIDVDQKKVGMNILNFIFKK